jgi:hypothetical protein
MAADAAWRGRQAKEKTAQRSPVRRSAVRVAIVTACILMVPLVAMQFSDEVVWTPGDFLFAAVLLGGTGLALDLALTSGGNITYRAAAGLALISGFLLIWVNAAVGIVGDEGEFINVLYLGVVAVGIAGSAIARLRPEGMARVLLAMALTQVSVALIALIAGKADAPGSSVSDIVGVNAFFVALSVASAWLFRRAARRRPQANA